MMKRTLTALSISAAALALTACSGGSGGGSASEVPADAGLVVTAVSGNRFDAASYTAKAGAVKVAYVGEPTANHTLLVTDAAGTAIGTKMKIQAGKTAVETFDLAAGTYKLICDVPGHTNMKAELVVS